MESSAISAPTPPTSDSWSWASSPAKDEHHIYNVAAMQENRMEDAKMRVFGKVVGYPVVVDKKLNSLDKSTVTFSFSSLIFQQYKIGFKQELT